MPQPPARLEFDRWVFTLQLTRRTRFRFHHGGILHGLLCQTLETRDLPEGVIPYACESGQVVFEPGDPYRVGVTFVGPARALRGVVESGLRRISQKTDWPGPPPVLGGNFALAGTEQAPAPDWQRLEDALAARDELTLRLVTPLRLKRPEQLQQRGSTFVDEDCFPADHFILRLFQRIRYLETGRYPDPAEIQGLMPAAALSLRAEPRQLLWLDVPVEGRPGADPTRPRGYTLGGVLGEVTLLGVGDAWKPWLTLGQFLHVGENTHHGLGAYRIRECEGLQSEPFAPARFILRRMAEETMLRTALQHVVTRSAMAGSDHVRPEDFVEDAQARIGKLSEDLRSARYRPDALLGFAEPQKDGKLRPLVIPTVRDRVAQRAVCDALGPAIDTLLEDCSYAFRRGLSRAGAARAIRIAYEDGYRYALDGDIEAFFDTVDWARVMGKLRALFPYEPVVELIRAWIESPVVFQGRTLTRDRGLPQGAPISPLLANLYLDEFDEALMDQGYKLVRYADDFVVLCRNLDEVRGAKQAAETALRDLGLRLNPEKTAPVSLDAGFTYLGYLFCRSVVLEREPATDEAPAPVRLEEIPPHSWLAQVPVEQVRALLQRGGESQRAGVVELQKLADGRAAPDERRPLYITSPEASVRLENDCLLIARAGGEAERVPIAGLSQVVFIGSMRVTTPAAVSLAQRGVSVHFCRRSGETIASIPAKTEDWTLWTAQAHTLENDSRRVAFAREIVAAKLHNSAALVVRFALHDGAETAGAIRGLERACLNKASLDTIRGLEGQGAALYFGALRASLADEWRFTGRKAHPSPDPVNAMLSFGYTILYHHLSTALIGEGLNPRLGLFHSGHGLFHALAADVQEEFRHLVDAHVWSMISRREIRPGDFRRMKGDSGCLLEAEARRRFVAAMENRLSTEFTPEGGQPLSYRAFMAAQARQVRLFFQGRVEVYRPLRVHA